MTSTYIYGNFSSFGGTSGATPHVAGVAALMLQAANLSNISLTPAQIETTMKRTGVPIYDSATGLTFPRIDAYKAVMAVLYDVFVSDLRESYSDSQGRKVFEFNIFNDFPSTVTLNWSLDTGDGNILKSGNFTMNPMSQNNNTLVTVDYTYSNIGTFNVTASVFSSNGTTRNQTIEVSVTKPNVRILNQSIAFASGTRRVFTFLVQNNASVSYSNITWQLNSTGASNLPINSTTDVTLAAGELMSVFVDYIYNQSGQHNVTITADYLNVHSEFDENNTVTIFDWA